MHFIGPAEQPVFTADTYHVLTLPSFLRLSRYHRSAKPFYDMLGSRKIGCLKDSEVLITSLQYLILKLQEIHPVITTRLTINGVQVLPRHMADEKGRIQVSLYPVSVYDALSVTKPFLSVLTR